jgi:hypothetical protein
MSGDAWFPRTPDEFEQMAVDSQPLMSRTNAVLSGKAPIVVIDGMAKANPTVSEVAAEYQRSR